MIKFKEFTKFINVINANQLIDKCVIGYNPILNTGMIFGNESQKTVSIQIDGFDWDKTNSEVCVGFDSLLSMIKVFDSTSKFDIDWNSNVLTLANDESIYTQKLFDINSVRGSHLDTSMRINGLNSEALNNKESFISIEFTREQINDIIDAIKNMKCTVVKFGIKNGNLTLTFENVSGSFDRVFKSAKTSNFDGYLFDANILKKVLDTVKNVNDNIRLNIIENQAYLHTEFDIDGNNYQLSATILRSVQSQTKSREYSNDEFDW